MFKQLTPVLIVKDVEPCLGFWTGGLGFKKVHEVPGPDGKVMFASVSEDNPAIGRSLDGHSIALFITVENLDEVEKAIAGAPVQKARHKTFYGSEEIYVAEPGGNTVGFAQMG